MEKKRRFVSTTDEKIEQKRLKMNAQKTIKQNIAAATLLHKYLKEKHLDTAFEHYNPQQLDECLVPNPIILSSAIAALKFISNLQNLHP
jgi:hypothetical protein